jgi:hypothetical protein
MFFLSWWVLLANICIQCKEGLLFPWRLLGVYIKRMVFKVGIRNVFSFIISCYLSFELESLLVECTWVVLDRRWKWHPYIVQSQMFDSFIKGDTMSRMWTKLSFNIHVFIYTNYWTSFQRTNKPFKN